MAKDIAFLFYPNDWLGGTQGFSFEHKGAYMELMIYQFNNGPMSIQDIKDVLGPYFDSMWERKLKAKFIFEEGKFFNKRVAQSKEKREKYSESRRNNFKGTSKEKMDDSVQISSAHLTSTVDQYLIDLPNSTQFEEVMKRTKLSKLDLEKYIEPFKLKAELEYPNFIRFVGHFKNYVAQELKEIANGTKQSNTKGKHGAGYNAEALSQLNSAIKKHP